MVQFVNINLSDNMTEEALVEKVNIFKTRYILKLSP